MKAEIAFVGDVHGTLSALRGLHDVLARRGGPHTVFLGDYINKGAESAEVMRLFNIKRGEGVDDTTFSLT